MLELREYLSRNHLEQVEIEIPVFDHVNLICGCIYAIFRNSETGELSIWDWKRKKQTVMTPQIRAQLNLYKHIYELCGKKISKLFVCNIYPTTGMNIQEVENDDNLVEEILEKEELRKIRAKHEELVKEMSELKLASSQILGRSPVNFVETMVLSY